MIIQSNTPEGAKAKIYLADGRQCHLPIKEYNTETKEAVVYELDAQGKVKTTDWEKSPDGKGMMRSILTKTMKLEDSYAEIDGKRV
jgi:hypothetical protein